MCRKGLRPCRCFGVAMAVAADSNGRKLVSARNDTDKRVRGDLASLSAEALRWLRAAGYEAVAIDSVAVEGVIDGFAVRQAGPGTGLLVFFRFIRSRGRTGVDAVRDVRRLMIGRAERGLLITTGSFTLAAREKADRDGAVRVELLDGQILDDLIAEAPGRGDEPADVLERLTGQVLRKRVVDIFPAGYLTVMAIIQGVALGLLLEKVIDHIFAHPVVVLGQGIATFITIVVASYEYLWFTAIMRWTPTFLDTLVPYLLGVAEIVPALLVGRFDLWWICTVVLFAVGGLAFWHTIWRSSAAMFESPPPAGQPAGLPQDACLPVYNDLRRLLRLLVSSCAVMVVVGVAIYILMISAQMPGWTQPVLPWIVTASATLIVVLSEVTLRKFYRDYGLPWRLRGSDVPDPHEPR